MSAARSRTSLVEAIGSGKYDFIVCNFANPDMVGHTGISTPPKRAVEALDAGSARGRRARAVGGAMLVTADHGNPEQMNDPQRGQPHTAHTLNPVPSLLGRAGDPARRRCAARLAPTLLPAGPAATARR